MASELGGGLYDRRNAIWIDDDQVDKLLYNGSLSHQCAAYAVLLGKISLGYYTAKVMKVPERADTRNLHLRFYESVPRIKLNILLRRFPSTWGPLVTRDSSFRKYRSSFSLMNVFVAVY